MVATHVGDDERRRWRHAAFEGLATGIEAAPDVTIGAYPTWTTRDLGVHVLQILGNATIALREGTGERPRPDVAATRSSDPVSITAAIVDGVDAAERALADCRHETVWTPVGLRAASFWGRRLLREAVLHRWDVEQAVGDARSPGDACAQELIDEFLDTDVTRTLAAGEHERVGVVAIRAGGASWRVDLSGGTVDTGDDAGATDDADGSGRDVNARISGEPAAVWLWLMRRDAGPGPLVEGDDEIVGAFIDLIEGFSRPAP